VTEGLLDVLEGVGGLTARPARAGRHNRRSSVARHILRLLGARRGRPAHLAGYGLPDLSSHYHDLDGAAACLAEAARELVPRYEPRVARVAVRAWPAPVDAGYVLGLRLYAQLHCGDGVTLELAVDGNAAVHLLNGDEDGSEACV